MLRKVWQIRFTRFGAKLTNCRSLSRPRGSFPFPHIRQIDHGLLKSKTSIVPAIYCSENKVSTDFCIALFEIMKYNQEAETGNTRKASLQGK